MSRWLSRVLFSPEVVGLFRRVVSEALGVSPHDPTDTLDSRIRAAVYEAVQNCPQRNCANFEPIPQPLREEGP